MKKLLLVLTLLCAATLSYSQVLADPCMVNPRKVAVINLTASGQLATALVNQTIYVCYLQFALSAVADNVALVEGTGSTCATNTAGMAGGATAATGWNLPASGQITSGQILSWAFKTASLGDNVCLLASSAAQISGVMVYVQL